MASAGQIVPVIVLTILALSGWTLDAQRTVRTAKIPGLDLPLKAGWKLLVSHECRFAVPASWRASEDASLATAPDGNQISVRMFQILSWGDHTSQILTAFGSVRVLHENSDRRLWFEIGDPPRVQHFIDVSNGLSVCNGLLDIRRATLTADDVSRIADSIGPAPSHFKPDEPK
jgi:hypothetical protein